MEQKQETTRMFKHEDFNMIQVISYYDEPQSFIIKEIKGNRFYLVNLLESKIEKAENDLVFQTKEIFTLLTEDMFQNLIHSKKTVRETILEGLNTETFIINRVNGKEITVTVIPVTKESLMVDVLDEPGFYDFTVAEENGSDWF